MNQTHLVYNSQNSHGSACIYQVLAVILEKIEL